MNTEITRPWSAKQNTEIAVNETRIDKIVAFDRGNLSEKQQKQIVNAYQMEAYDMAAEYAWKKAITKLRSSLENLGMDFIAEFVQRDGIDEFTPIENVLTERASIDLAERLGVINSTGALKLRQSHELVNHYLSGRADGELDALGCLNIIKTCFQYILSEENVEVAVAFSEFRQRLLNTDVTLDDADVKQVLGSPLFYIRTCCTILLTAIKRRKQVEQEHALANLALLLPEMWTSLASSDKWNIGEAYRDVVASGDTTATKGLKIALSKVKGFDYVPESLRSSTFKEMARKLIDVHDSMNNFYNEPSVVKALASLGTRIPEPAFKLCIDAYLLVYLGNYYGISRNAAPIAETELRKISRDRWQSYFMDIINTDDRILSNLETENQVGRFKSLLKGIGCTDFTGLPKYNQILFDSIIAGDYIKVQKIAKTMYSRLI